MTDLPLLDRLNALRFPGTAWTSEDRPVLVADGRVLSVKLLTAVLEINDAYVVGARPADFERLTKFLRPKQLRFYELPVADLATLPNMGALTTLVIEWNTKLKSLDPLANLPELTTLSIVDTPKVRDIGPVTTLGRLRALEYSGGMWSKNVAVTLDPIGELGHLEELRLTNIRVLEGGLRPVARCSSLKRLDVSNQFATADYAYMSVARPDVECHLFAPYVRVDIDDRDVMVVGSGKPFLNSRVDRSRLQRYVDDFRRLQDQFAAEL